VIRFTLLGQVFAGIAGGDDGAQLESAGNASSLGLAKRARSMRKPGWAATPPEHWTVADEAVSAGWERLNGRHGRGLLFGWERA
jgi:hypothetical protein